MSTLTLARATTPPPVIPPAALAPTGREDRPDPDLMTQVLRAVTDRAYRRRTINEYRAQGGPALAANFANAVRYMSREAGPAYRPITRARNLARMNRQAARALLTEGGGA